MTHSTALEGLVASMVVILCRSEGDGLSSQFSCSTQQWRCNGPCGEDWLATAKVGQRVFSCGVNWSLGALVYLVPRQSC